MTDVVEAGPPERTRRGVVIGALTVLVLAAVAFRATRSDEPRAADRPPASPAGSEAPEPSPDATSDRLPSEVRRAGRWLLPPLDEPTGLFVAASGRELRVLDVDTGRVTVTALPGRGEVDPVAPVPGGWLVLQHDDCDPEVAAYCPTPQLYAVRGGRPELLAPRASTAVVDAAAETVWLTYHRTPARGGDEQPRWLERRALDSGRLLGRPVRLRGVEDVVGVVAEGAVVGTLSPGPVSVVGAAGRRVVLPKALVLGGSGRLVAWLPELCRGSCALKLTDVTSGRTTELGTLGFPVAVAVHPVGRFVAVAPFAEQPVPDGVLVYDTDTGDATRLGIGFPPDVESLTWSPDGWLLAAHSVEEERHRAAPVELALWRPGLARAVNGPDLRGWYQPKLAVAAGDMTR